MEPMLPGVVAETARCRDCRSWQLITAMEPDGIPGILRCADRAACSDREDAAFAATFGDNPRIMRAAAQGKENARRFIRGEADAA